MDMNTNNNEPQTVAWLVRISEIFSGIANEILQRFEARSITKLGTEYYLIKTPKPDAVGHSDAAKFVRWNMPVQHAWPCNPQKMEGFIEKAAQTLFKKFGARNPQTILVGQINAGSPDRYYKGLATNLRGRVLQLFPPLRVKEVEEQNPEAETLFCLVGREGLFCGMQSPRASNGFYAGGSKYIGLESPDLISRAGAKIAEALHYLLLYRPLLPAGSHWLELGASPGGMTAELLARGQRVTALDVAVLDQRLQNRRGLKFVRCDVAAFQPEQGAKYDALLSDMNGDPLEAMKQVIRLSEFLKMKGLVVFTLKIPRVETMHEPLEIFDAIVQTAASEKLNLFAQTHLTYNRHEFTLFFSRSE